MKWAEVRAVCLRPKRKWGYGYFHHCTSHSFICCRLCGWGQSQRTSGEMWDMEVHLTQALSHLEGCTLWTLYSTGAAGRDHFNCSPMTRLAFELHSQLLQLLPDSKFNTTIIIGFHDCLLFVVFTVFEGKSEKMLYFIFCQIYISYQQSGRVSFDHFEHDTFVKHWAVLHFQIWP